MSDELGERVAQLEAFRKSDAERMDRSDKRQDDCEARQRFMERTVLPAVFIVMALGVERIWQLFGNGGGIQ